jgi:hypothetical protein
MGEFGRMRLAQFKNSIWSHALVLVYELNVI